MLQAMQSNDEDTTEYAREMQEAVAKAYKQRLKGVVSAEERKRAKKANACGHSQQRHARR